MQKERCQLCIRNGIHTQDTQMTAVLTTYNHLPIDGLINWLECPPNKHKLLTFEKVFAILSYQESADLRWCQRESKWPWLIDRLEEDEGEPLFTAGGNRTWAVTMKFLWRVLSLTMKLERSHGSSLIKTQTLSSYAQRDCMATFIVAPCTMVMEWNHMNGYGERVYLQVFK